MADETIQTADAAALAQVQAAARSRLSSAVNEPEAPAAGEPPVEAKANVPATPEGAVPGVPAEQPAIPPAEAVAAEANKEVEPEPEPEPVVLEPSPEEMAQLVQQAEAALKHQIDNDREAQSWIRDWTANKETLETLGPDLAKGGKGTIAEIEKNIIKAEGQLEADVVQQDEFTKSGIQQRIRDLKADLREAKGDRFDREREQQELDAKYTARFNRYRDDIKSRLRASQEAKAADSRINVMATEFKAEWDETVPRIGTEKGIPKESLGRFKERAEEAIDVHLNNIGPVKNLPAFIRKQADRYLADMDADHRARSGQYSKAVMNRSGQPAPASPAGAAPPAAAEPSKPPMTLKELYARTHVRLAQIRRGA